jgi:hypothetical protein
MRRLAGTLILTGALTLIPVAAHAGPIQQEGCRPVLVSDVCNVWDTGNPQLGHPKGYNFYGWVGHTWHPVGSWLHRNVSDPLRCQCIAH